MYSKNDLFFYIFWLLFAIIQENEMESEQDGIVNKLMEEMLRMKMQQQTTIQEMEAEEEKMVMSLAERLQASQEQEHETKKPEEGPKQE